MIFIVQLFQIAICWQKKNLGHQNEKKKPTSNRILLRFKNRIRSRHCNNDTKHQHRVWVKKTHVKHDYIFNSDGISAQYRRLHVKQPATTSSDDNSSDGSKSSRGGSNGGDNNNNNSDEISSNRVNSTDSVAPRSFSHAWASIYDNKSDVAVECVKSYTNQEYYNVR